MAYRQLLVIVVCAIMMTSAGCAGWGEDGPAETADIEGESEAEADAQTQEETSTTEDTTEDDSSTEEPESEPESDEESSSSSSSESDSESTAGAEASPKTETDSSSGSESNVKAEGGSSDVDVHIDDSSSTEVDASSKSKSDVDAESSSDSDSTSKSKSDSDADAESESESDSDADADSTSDSESESTSDSESELKEPETNTLTVTVTDENGTPVEGADVYVNEYPDGETGIAKGTTDGMGKVTFELEDGAYELSVGHEKYELGQYSDNRAVKMDGEDNEYHIKMSGTVPPASESRSESPTSQEESTSESNGEDEDTGNGEGESDKSESSPPKDRSDTPGKYDNKSCDAFDTHKEAQEYYDEAPEERSQLDGDNNDIPCEHLREEADETNSLTVRVVDENGTPVQGGTVHVSKAGTGESVTRGTTGELGKTTFELEDGRYELIVGHDKYELAQYSDNRLVRMDGEDNEYRIQMSGSVTPEKDANQTQNETQNAVTAPLAV